MRTEMPFDTETVDYLRRITVFGPGKVGGNIPNDQYIDTGTRIPVWAVCLAELLVGKVLNPPPGVTPTLMVGPNAGT